MCINVGVNSTFTNEENKSPCYQSQSRYASCVGEQPDSSVMISPWKPHGAGLTEERGGWALGAWPGVSGPQLTTPSKPP